MSGSSYERRAAVADVLSRAGVSRESFYRLSPSKLDCLMDAFDLADPIALTVGWRCSTACYIGGVSREISQRELRNQSGEIMRALDGGETFIVTRNGVPVGELTPLRRHRFVAAETAVALFTSAPAIDYRQFRADLDTAVSQETEPRG